MAYHLQLWKFFRRAGVLMLWLVLAACSASVTPLVKTPVMVIELPTVTVIAPTLAATRASVPATGGVDARQAVLNAMHAVGTAGPYHIKSTTTVGSTTLVTTGEVRLPDHFHLTTNGEELLIIGDKTYRKSNGRWVNFPIDIGKQVSGMMGTLTSEGEKGISDAQLLGSGTVNGITSVEYQFKQTVNVGSTTLTSTVKLWVDSLRGLPVQQQIDGVVNGQTTSTLQEITYDPSITFPTP